MPWKETCSMEERGLFISEFLKQEASVTGVNDYPRRCSRAATLRQNRRRSKPAGCCAEAQAIL
jgi:hypothetical protein